MAWKEIEQDYTLGLDGVVLAEMAELAARPDPQPVTLKACPVAKGDPAQAGGKASPARITSPSAWLVVVSGDRLGAFVLSEQEARRAKPNLPPLT